MCTAFRFLLLFCLVAPVGPLLAAETGQSLSLGGAATSSLESTNQTYWENGALSLGLAPDRQPNPLTVGAQHGLRQGGFLAWQGDAYRLDATLSPSQTGSLALNLGVSGGAAPGDLGTSYGMRIGAQWSAERFTVNPISRLGVDQVIEPASAMDMTVSVNHALTSSLRLVGSASATHSTYLLPDGSVGENHFLLGAGLGYRF